MAARLRRRRAVLLVTAICLAAGLAAPAVAGPGEQPQTSTPTGPPSTSLLAQESQSSISSITINRTTVRAGETVAITAIVENTATERQTIPTTLTVGGETRATQRPSVDPEFPVVVRFEVTLDDPGEYAVAVNGVEAEQTVTVRSPGGDGSEDANEQSSENSASADGPPTLSVSSENITVESVEVEPSSVDPGQTVEVTALLVNTRPEIVNVSVALEIDGTVVTTSVAENVLSQTNNPGLTIPYTFEYTPEESGTYTVSVNGTQAGSDLEVSGGGGLFGFLGGLPLGFLPLGLLRPLFLFVVLPLALVYGVLKALAIYLGY
ncbi:hypothetical protein GRX03_04300 [Halovenus sp. WSH3]|uniref:CARDB domain-containing protein n=1 Tax=Halovenus carboxidivorans TaxID=2692199 RepID=A0A6B0T0V1_9EURY|nr:hypothetical protein [Halovenus carboxidivorans]MXR50827.1 hypothetical protein [Halovenus carboxidivorans]